MLSASVDTLKGVGKKYAEDLSHMGIETIEDLLFHFPFRYDFVEIKPLAELIHQDKVTIVGSIVAAPQVAFGRKPRLMFTVQVDGIAIRATMFNRMFAKDKLQPGTVVTLTGKWDAHRLQITVSHFQIGAPHVKKQINPIYSTKGNVTTGRLQPIIQQALLHYGDAIAEIIPQPLLTAYKIPERKNAVRMLHRPNNEHELKHARRRFVFEEFLLYQLKMTLYKQRRKAARQGNPYQFDQTKVATFIESLPFTLTIPQQRSLEEILSDMQSGGQMYRLLQGDVGSGKTAVATVCLYAAVTVGFQGALMVPTEILAEQHTQSVKQLLGDEVEIALLTSSVKGKERKQLLAAIRDHEVQLVIGTHSLIQEEVVFDRLGLIIIDEQHRFGVEQRRLLREKGHQPDVLLMTATPIPRTLAITAFGDLDISTIDELPLGRKEVLTYWVKDNMFERILRFIEKKVRAGEQAYIVSPLIEESEAFDYQNAIDIYEQLIQFYPQHIQVGLLHGRLPNDEKEAIMKQFIQGNIHVLVSTTVIEVGVNVPNATIMVIYDAERFGLSQLHQLRGRVGRGDKQSYCILIADPKGEVGKERMRIMLETNDGFRLAEEDLKLRGPGDFFGKKQSGIPEFKIADPVHDFRALEVAQRDAAIIIAENRLETDPDYKRLKEILTQDIEGQFD